MVDYPGLNLIDAILRSGHDFVNDCNIFVYIMHLLPMLARAGKALARYPNPRKKVVSPRCVFINEENSQLVNNFVSDLMPCAYRGFEIECELRPYRMALFAVYLMRLEEHNKDYPDNVVWRRVKEVVKRFKPLISEYDITLLILKYFN